MKSFRASTRAATPASMLIVGLIVLVRLSVFLLHTHVQAEFDDGSGSRPSITQDVHCIACDLESTAAVEATPVFVLPSACFATLERVILPATRVRFFARQAVASRGPPICTI